MLYCVEKIIEKDKGSHQRILCLENLETKEKREVLYEMKSMREIKEGDIVDYDEKRCLYCEQETQERKQKLQDKMNCLLKRKE